MFTAKSNACMLALDSLQASVQYNNIGKHLKTTGRQMAPEV